MITLGCSFWLGGFESLANSLISCLYILLLSACLFTGLVVAAYVGWVGFIAVAMSGVIAISVPVALRFPQRENPTPSDKSMLPDTRLWLFASTLLRRCNSGIQVGIWLARCPARPAVAVSCLSVNVKDTLILISS